MIYGDDQDGDGIPDNPTTSARRSARTTREFNIFNTDRQLAALQTAVTMLRPLPEQKSLIYFASGLRLNGTDNQAQLRATINAAIRANVTLNPIDARGLVALAPLGDATRASPGGIGMFTGAARRKRRSTNFQRSQDTLYALAKDTGGKAMFDYNDLSLGIVQAAQAVDQLLHHRLLQHAHGDRRQVPPRQGRRWPTATGGRARVPPGLLRRQGRSRSSRRRTRSGSSKTR